MFHYITSKNHLLWGYRVESILLSCIPSTDISWHIFYGALLIHVKAPLIEYWTLFMKFFVCCIHDSFVSETCLTHMYMWIDTRHRINKKCSWLLPLMEKRIENEISTWKCTLTRSVCTHTDSNYHTHRQTYAHIGGSQGERPQNGVDAQVGWIRRKSIAYVEFGKSNKQHANAFCKRRRMCW